MTVPPKYAAAHQGSGVNFSDNLVVMGLSWSWRRLQWPAPFQLQVTRTLSSGTLRAPRGGSCVSPGLNLSSGSLLPEHGTCSVNRTSWGSRGDNSCDIGVGQEELYDLISC